MKKVDIYVETTLKGCMSRHGRYAVVVEFINSKGEEITRERFVASKGTPNQMILKALNTGLKILTKECYVVVHTDNDYVAGCIRNGYVQKWKDNKWIRDKGKPLSNLEEWQQYWNLSQIHNIDVCCAKDNKYKNWIIREMNTREVDEDENKDNSSK